jgi:hypothetical protein
MSDTSAMYRSSVSSATASPGHGQASASANEPSFDIDQEASINATSFADFNFNFLDSQPNVRDASDGTYSNSTIKSAGTTFLDESQSLWQSFPTSMTDLDHNILRSVSTHPIFSQDQVASFQNSFEKSTHHKNDCLALALQLVNDLSVTHETCMVATPDPMTCGGSHKSELRDVDTVLFINRDAAQAVRKILTCTCSSDQAVVLACYLVTTKIVDWYGAVIEAVGESSDEFVRPSKDLVNKTSQKDMAKRIIARPVYMGSKHLVI